MTSQIDLMFFPWIAVLSMIIVCGLVKQMYYRIFILYFNIYIKIYFLFLDVYKIQTIKILVIHLYSLVQDTALTLWNSLYDQIPGSFQNKPIKLSAII